MLIGCGRIKAFINCYIANSGYTNVCLLKMGRNLRDEGLGGSLRIMRNVVGDKELRARILQMRSVFTRYEKIKGLVIGCFLLFPSDDDVAGVVDNTVGLLS